MTELVCTLNTGHCDMRAGLRPAITPDNVRNWPCYGLSKRSANVPVIARGAGKATFKCPKFASRQLHWELQPVEN
eukprot:6177211-Pleurochrysis_carterae.AAC.2